MQANPSTVPSSVCEYNNVGSGTLYVGSSSYSVTVWRTCSYGLTCNTNGGSPYYYIYSYLPNCQSYGCSYYGGHSSTSPITTTSTIPTTISTTIPTTTTTTIPCSGTSSYSSQSWTTAANAISTSFTHAGGGSLSQPSQAYSSYLLIGGTQHGPFIKDESFTTQFCAIDLYEHNLAGNVVGTSVACTFIGGGGGIFDIAYNGITLSDAGATYGPLSVYVLEGDSSKYYVVYQNPISFPIPYWISGQSAGYVRSYSSVTPVISDVRNDNVGNGQYLITCPTTPDPTHTLEYFTSSPFIMGNRCLASTASLVSTAVFNVALSCTNLITATAQASLTIQNIATGNIQNLGYSGMVHYADRGVNDISNGYDSESYIFGQVPPSTQYGMWTWSAEYADLSHVGVSSLKVANTIGGLAMGLGPYSHTCSGGSGQYGCIYPYTYTVCAIVNKIYNANVLIPTLEQSVTNYMEFNGNYLTPFTEGDSYTGTPIVPWSQSLTAGSLPFLLCAGNLAVHFGDLGSGIPCLSIGTIFDYVGTATLTFGGKTYSNVNVYSVPQSGVGSNTFYAGNYVVVYGLETERACLGSLCGPPVWDGKYSGGMIPNSVTQQYNAIGALPYLLYNLSMPAEYSMVNNYQTFLNLSFDLYSSRNFLSGAENMGGVPLYTDSGFFAGERDTGLLNLFSGDLSALNNAYASTSSAMDSSADIFLSTLTKPYESIPGQQISKVGIYLQYQIKNPIYIASSPGDYVYILSNAGFWNSGAYTANTYLYTLRFIPKGYLNMSTYPPSSVSTTSSALDSGLTSTPGTWNSLWANYWTNTGPQQGYSLYITSVADLSSCGFSLSNIWGGVTCSGTTPIAVAADYASDVFILGHNNSATYNAYTLTEIPVNTMINTITNSITNPNNYAAGQELAVSPSGQYVFVANPLDSNGVINIYKTPTSAGGFNYSGNMILSYSNSSYNFSLGQYLKNGGPFGTTAVKNAYSGVSTSAYNDVSSNHHPIALEDVGGIVYVLDEWNIVVSGKSSSILMLRAFQNATHEVPIHGLQYSSLISTSGSAWTGNAPSAGWSPYGWPLSANIGTGSSSSDTFCAADCDPVSTSDAYPPVGPLIGSSGYSILSKIGLSADFNGTLYLIAHATSANPPYTELLVFKMPLSNYTQQSLGAYSPYVCYTNNSYSGSPCIVENTPLLSNMIAPVLGVPSSFSFVENEGSPTVYFSEQSQVASSLPSGAPSGSGSSGNTMASNEASSGTIQNGGSVPSNFLNLGTGSASALPKLPILYVNSVISGSLLVPLCYQYTVTQTWSPGTPVVINSACGTSSSMCTGDVMWPTPNPTVTTSYYCGTAAAPLRSNYVNETIEGGGTYLQKVPNQNYYTANLSDAGAISLPYLDYDLFTSRIFGEMYVNVTVNPLAPQFYTTYGSKPQVANAVQTYNYGLVTVSQSAFGTTYPAYAFETASPMYAAGTITFSSSDSTTTFTHQQCTLSSGSCSTAYTDTAATEPAIYWTYTGSTNTNNMQVILSCSAYSPGVQVTCTATTTAVQTGENCGSSCPAHYYYTNQPFSGNSAFFYASNTQINSVALFTVYEQTSQLASTILDLRSNPGFFGYARFIYTFVDSFNNTIWAPLDTDLAYTTQVSLNPIVTVNVLNANDSNVVVTGTLTYTRPDGTFPLVGRSVYLYYDTNLNYYDTSNNPKTSPLGYLWDDALCAFSPGTTVCQFANPLYTTLQPVGSQTGYVQEADQPTYNPDFNSSNVCNKLPTSLLASTNVIYNCNIYGTDGQVSLPASKYLNGVYKICLPQFSNGTGLFTSQLGLVNVVTTDANGNFQYSFDACGNGDALITASYFGYPPPEPVLVNQPLIPQSGGAGEFTPPSGVSSQSYEFQYSYAPTSSSTDISIGAFALSFGNLNTLIILALMVTVLLIARRRRT